MADLTNETVNTIEAPEKYPIICPYCFNQEIDGKPFYHTDVKFRAETSFDQRDINALERELALSDEDDEEKQEEFRLKKRFIRQVDKKYQAFWDEFDGQTTECPSAIGDKQRLPWELPIVSLGDGIQRQLADADGFIVRAVDDFGQATISRVCPFCHNPLPLGYGKYPVKFISIVGVSGAGKTVYISQLLKGMPEYAAKVGLSAYYTSQHETEFIRNNRVEKEHPLPLSTPPRRLSQPMFYDIVSSESNKVSTNTVVLHDIAGENCVNTLEIRRFARFIEHADGIIVLIDPRQLNFLPDEAGDTTATANPEAVINTLRDPSGKRRRDEKCTIPMAICISKSDQCSEILPPLSQQPVLRSSTGADHLPTKKFDGTTYNDLSASLAHLMESNAPALCVDLQNGYENYNFFTISAIGCRCGLVGNGGFMAPLSTPSPKRIEEPILWLFKHFGFIGSNTKVRRPFPIRHADRYRMVTPLFRKPYCVPFPPSDSVFEGEKLRRERQVLMKKHWWMWWDKGTWINWPWDDDASIEIRNPGKEDSDL